MYSTIENAKQKTPKLMGAFPKVGEGLLQVVL